MISFRELKKAAKENIEGKERRLVVLGNTATQFLSSAICGYAKIEKINLTVLDMDYNQIDAQLLDAHSECNTSNPDFIFLYLASEKLYEEFLDLEAGKREEFAVNYIEEIIDWWSQIRKNTGARILMPNLPEIDDKAMGELSAKVGRSFLYQLRKLNFFLQEEMEKATDVYPIDFSAIQNRLGRETFHNPVLYYNAKMAIDMNVLPYAAKAVVDVLKSLSGRIHKCVILDLDNTLWGGVIGDDGLGGIEIGELGRGHAFTNLQRYLKQLKECGILLAVCSKNNEEIAKEPFEKLSEMVLKLSDFSIFVANWDDKATNIRLIQETLNIGMDSLVFLDDNPFERNLVREMIPEIMVPELPEDPAEYLTYLQSLNLFDTVSNVSESQDRTKQYREEFERKKAQNSFASIDEYLESLQMEGEAKAFEGEKFARIAELSQRSNQFNLRTVRYSEKEIEEIAKSDGFLTLFFTLKDRFGEYGLVSAVILKKKDDKTLFVDTWFMSCRVLKRGMEDFIVNAMIRTAAANGFERLEAEYIPTPKNKMVEKIYATYGFEEYAPCQYCIEVGKYVERKTFIKEI